MAKLTKYQQALNHMKELGSANCDMCIENFLAILVSDYNYKGSIDKAVDWWFNNPDKG